MSTRSIMSVHLLLHGKEIVFYNPVTHERTPENGDKVILLPGRHHPKLNGREGKISAIESDLYKVDFGDFQWWMSESEFEVIDK